MKSAKIIIDYDFIIGDIDPRIYGSFIEHLGRAVYGGIYEPGHPTADENGFRKDVISLVQKLNVPIIRYPGGNFVSGFNWEDSIGPIENRPKRLDLAWSTTESNHVGLHEFVEWTKKVNSEVMYAVNLGTRGVDAARNIVEYANHPGGTYWSDLRRKNGVEKPFGIKLWCLGNEMDGPWQINSRNACDYGKIANESAKLMKTVDSSIEVVACGSSSQEISTFGQWEYEVLENCYENVDYISLHCYYGNPTNDSASFLSHGIDMDEYIKTVVSICDAVGGKKKSKKKINISFDEWNVWYHSHEQDKEIIKNHRWDDVLPLLEDIYNFEDALLIGSMLISLIRNADRVKIACIAQLVNVIAPIITFAGGGVLAQTIYWPLLHASKYGRGIALRVIVQSPVYDCTIREGVPMIDAVAVLADDKTLTIFAVNRDINEDIELNCDLRAFGELGFEQHILLHNDDLKATNTKETPFNVSEKKGPGGIVDKGQIKMKIPKLSWNIIRFKIK